MDNTCYTFKYSNVETVCQFLNPYDYLCVIDISNAYRSVNIYPSHVYFQACTWILQGQPKVYLDHCLSFGLKSAPFIFTKMGDFIVKCLGFNNVTRMVNYIDDFLICAPTEEACQFFMNKFLVELHRFGFSCNKDKIKYPDTKVVYLGIEIDTVNMNLSLPTDKLDNVRDMIKLFATKKVATKLELQRLAGNLSHCSTVIRAGKTFNRRVINIIKYFPLNRRNITLSCEFFADLSWWSAFAKMFNGTGKIIKCDRIDIVIYTDASGLGFGGYVEAPYDYFFGIWSNSICIPCKHSEQGPTFDNVSASISQKELWPILISCKRLATTLRGKNFLIYTDNQSVQSMINSGKSKDIHAMSMLREIFWICFVYNFNLSAKYIKGIENVQADFLSRIFAFSKSYLLTNTLFLSLFSCCRESVITSIPEERNEAVTTNGICRRDLPH